MAKAKKKAAITPPSVKPKMMLAIHVDERRLVAGRLLESGEMYFEFRLDGVTTPLGLSKKSAEALFSIMWQLRVTGIDPDTLTQVLP